MMMLRGKITCAYSDCHVNGSILWEFHIEYMQCDPLSGAQHDHANLLKQDENNNKRWLTACEYQFE